MKLRLYRIRLYRIVCDFSSRVLNYAILKMHKMEFQMYTNCIKFARRNSAYTYRLDKILSTFNKMIIHEKLIFY